MKKTYDSPTLDISEFRIPVAFAAVSALTPDVEYDDLNGWSPIMPPHH